MMRMGKAASALPANDKDRNAMTQQRRRPRAIAISRTGGSRSQNELIAFAAVLALFTVLAYAIFPSF
ncbi:hypothetical protein PYH37_002922 [Sinorhizobium numidicum]|uniref:Uncharacterized protein n=1 Tax=Sinorhizobium numidicum TaxID=680248 RepID=A0ABY8D6G8_9HYPH|nr:hypothetical protein [Sinorhizobium numidicum]WEX78072.1 hypothetical protein PYH37_002922 [Sinorhizobium numidicum]WEX84731.1 hypothetical protein PYH38_003635 [Sinorhizobium numidicum]